MRRSLLGSMLLLTSAACDCSSEPPANPEPDAQAELDAGDEADARVEPDACVPIVLTAETRRDPVDIVWLIDNSASMQAAIASVTEGINAFATRIGESQLDYHVVLLSLRSETSPISVGGSMRYPICVPPPLAGDAHCGDGERFHHSSIDVRSSQTLEQLLGTLGQTEGFTAADERGGEPWAQALRPAATKAIIVVTDDNARLSVNDFEHFAGGKNPFNSTQLPPGLLMPSWTLGFEGYAFHGVYGWGSETDATARCQYPSNASAPSSGPTYTELVLSTGGTRAKICDGADGWSPFFDGLVDSIASSARLTCSFPFPSEAGDAASRLTLQITDEAVVTSLPRVAGPQDCTPDGGWFTDDAQAPTQVTLCPTTCVAASQVVGPGRDGRLDLLVPCPDDAGP